MTCTIKRIEEASDGRWHCPPQNQGQIVVCEYAYDCEHPDDLEEWPDAWSEPLRGDWQEVSS